MTIFILPLFNSTVMPDTTGKAFFAPPSNHGFSNAVELALILADDASECGVYADVLIAIAGLIPSAAVLRIQWAINSGTAEEIAFRFDYKCVDVGEDTDFDPKVSSDESLTGQLSAAHATAKRLREKSITLTHGNFADQDLCRLWFGRDNDHADDDIAVDAVIFKAWIEITAP